jgi:hypothetical protein
MTFAGANALFLPPPIWKTACRPNRIVKRCGLKPVYFGLNRAEWDFVALITARLEWRLGKQAS